MRCILLAALMVLPGLAMGAAPGRTEVEPYRAANGLVTPAFYFCDTHEGNLAGACFRLEGEESFVSVFIADDFGGEVVGVARLYDNENRLVARHVFCNELVPVPVPDGATKLLVLVGPAGADAEKLGTCDTPSAPTKGLIHLTTYE